MLGLFLPIEKNIFAVPNSDRTCGFAPIHPVSVSLSHDCLLKSRARISITVFVVCTLRVHVSVGVRFGCRGPFLFPYKAVRFHRLNLWRTRRTRALFGIPSQHAHDAGRLGKCCDFRMFGWKSWENYVNRGDSHILRRTTEMRKGGGRKQRWESRTMKIVRCIRHRHSACLTSYRNRTNSSDL